MKKNALLSFAALLALGMTLTSCKDEENPTTTPTASTTTRLVATLNGASEKPTSTTSAATGNFVGDLNTTTRVLSYTVTYTGPFSSSLTGGHLHRINAANGTGPVDIPFTSLTSPITGTTAALAQTKVDSMLNGFYYANLHTSLYANGEIRGDIKKQ
ncbi:CHRD domain-containing protein [Spirosoma agri]|uniref:CHRD domain-containing protein n=1 Tax=Spirosoma agri TaxID=1987381 RepID=A0A6M0IG95_9BACT|nr:CHRD domain-containing protein [Spirosoma agri]NEU66381.1 CHRD domain-containing protein [Spirosoma agri]